MTADTKHPEAKEEARLVSSCKRGDTQAFEKLVIRHQKRVFNISLRMIGNQDDACDITQDTFVTAWRKIGDFRGEAQFSTWLIAIAINLSRNRIEQIRTNSNREAFSLDECPPGSSSPLAGSIPSSLPNALENLEKDEIKRFLDGCISKLPLEFKEVLVLRDMQECSYEEVRDALGLKDGTVRSRLFRARESVRDCLKTVFSIS